MTIELESTENTYVCTQKTFASRVQMDPQRADRAPEPREQSSGGTENTSEREKVSERETFNDLRKKNSIAA
jgi:hypothetical protein